MSIVELGVLAAMATAISGPMVTVFIWWASRIDGRLDTLSHDVSDLKSDSAAMRTDIGWLKSHIAS